MQQNQSFFFPSPVVPAEIRAAVTKAGGTITSVIIPLQRCKTHTKKKSLTKKRRFKLYIYGINVVARFVISLL